MKASCTSICPSLYPCSVHTQGSKVISCDHPDARAVFYEQELYSKRRINDLLQVSWNGLLLRWIGRRVY